MKKFGMIIALIFAAGILFCAKEGPIGQRIPLALVIGWTGYNAATYRGRYRPRTLYMLKVCWPVILFVLISVLTENL